MNGTDDEMPRVIRLGCPVNDGIDEQENTVLAIRACLADLMTDAEESGLKAVAKFIDVAVAVIDSGMYRDRKGTVSSDTINRG